MTNRKDTRQQPKASDWPNPIQSREELDSALEAGEKSGTSPHSILEVAKRKLTRLKNG